MKTHDFTYNVALHITLCLAYFVAWWALRQYAAGDAANASIAAGSQTITGFGA